MLFVGDDWAEDHHDVEIVDEAGKVLARRRLSEGLEGITRLHALVAEQMPDDWSDLDPGEAAARGKVGIETDRGSWVGALVAADWRCFRSTRCPWPATGSGTRRLGRSPTPPTLTCWPDRAAGPV